MGLPQDPFMLMSLINMNLRDGEYDSLEDFCSAHDIEKSDILKKLGEAGFIYDEKLKKFY